MHKATLYFTAALLVALPSFAAQAQTAAKTAAAAEAAQGRGVVRKVDVAAGVINIAHEAIPALKWPAMTMDFRAREAKLLAGVRPGQTVVFGLAKDPAGYVITRIEAAK